MFHIIILFTITIFLTEAPSERSVNAQVTITPGIDEEVEEESEPEPELEPEPEPEPELEPEPEPQQTTPGSERISQVLDYAHFIPLTNSPGNQVKLTMNYTLEDSSLFNRPINAVMEVYSTNQSLIRVSSFPEPLMANQSGEVELATTFTDENINEVVATATFTDEGKLVSISNPITVNLNLGQIIEQ